MDDLESTHSVKTYITRPQTVFWT